MTRGSLTSIALVQSGPGKKPSHSCRVPGEPGGTPDRGRGGGCEEWSDQIQHFEGRAQLLSGRTRDDVQGKRRVKDNILCLTTWKDGLSLTGMDVCLIGGS